MKTILFLLSFSFIYCSISFSQLVNFIDKNVELKKAQKQYHILKGQLKESDRFPSTYDRETDEIKTSSSGWWCSGFYPGSLFYLYEETGDAILYEEALRMLDVLEKEQFNTTTHDLGFMMYCSFGNAYRLNPTEQFRKVIIQSAQSLASRFSPVTGCIRSWNSKSEDFLVIIDNMMNLELLFETTILTGDSTFYDIAMKHADTTIKNHFRPDHSSYHVVNYNPETGEVKQRRTHQGFADETAWARGQAWGLYGFTMVYRYTNEERFLNKAIEIAEFILNHPNLPQDGIPYWDFDAPDIPDALRDASAAAIISSALFELNKYVQEPLLSEKYNKEAKRILKSLASKYQAETGSNGGFIIKHGVGHLPGSSEVDAPLSYADYYYIEALKRMQD